MLNIQRKKIKIQSNKNVMIVDKSFIYVHFSDK